MFSDSINPKPYFVIRSDFEMNILLVVWWCPLPKSCASNCAMDLTNLCKFFYWRRYLSPHQVHQIRLVTVNMGAHVTAVNSEKPDSLCVLYMPSKTVVITLIWDSLWVMVVISVQWSLSRKPLICGWYTVVLNL